MRALIVGKIPIKIDLAQLLRESEGFVVRLEPTGEKGLECAFHWLPNVVLLSQELPGIPGLEVCRLLKGDPRLSHIPVVVISEPVPEADVVQLLRAGADELLVAPFSEQQVLWRVRAVLRRFERARELPREALEAGPILLVVEERAVYVQGKEVLLRKKEFDLLAALMRAPGRVFTRQGILEAVWGYEPAVSPRVVDRHISRLRQKLGAAGRRYLLSIHGLGYKFRKQRLTLP